MFHNLLGADQTKRGSKSLLWGELLLFKYAMGLKYVAYTYLAAKVQWIVMEW